MTPTIRGSEFELLNEQTLFAAEQERLEERDEMRRRFGGSQAMGGGMESYAEHCASEKRMMERELI